ncbi:lytic transglycosylase domain-containing protein [uncultured Aquitalea sp.]|uniref:lytic transglycosylase domain-containing protein n=1 Tax=uncultured Aquitalea sp. TaxID=540272 RepID=UPI0025D16859|nr:lytic transglycosylase domain-containing protein [uncultured Aquitalea sp.]
MRLIHCFAALLAAVFATSVHADLYGFVDADGQVHLANRKIDERYQLYQKSVSVGAADATAALSDATTPGLGATLSLDAPRPVSPAVEGLKPAPAPVYNAKLAAQYTRLINQTAREFKLDANLLHSIVTVESGYNPQALSPKGAVGLMQVIPATGERFGVTELSDPKQNLRAGARYLRFLLGLFNNDLPLAVAAYNAGEGAVQKYRNTIPPYDETRDYVAKVLASYEKRTGVSYQRQSPLQPANRRVRAVIMPAIAMPAGTDGSAL